MAALKYWIWLTTQRGVGQRDVLKMLDHFVTPERIYYADPEEYELLELRPAAVAGLQDKNLSRAEDILAQCERLGLKILTLQDAQYPERLRQLADPPAVLYIRGRTFRFDEEAAIGVVGARTPTAYGERMAEQLGFELAGGAALVVSGIAEGLDSRAIRGALKGDRLEIRCVNTFVAETVDRPDILEVITRKASALLGRPISVAVVDMSAKPAGNPKMEQLLNFGRAHSDVVKIKEH